MATSKNKANVISFGMNLGEMYIFAIAWITGRYFNENKLIKKESYLDMVLDRVASIIDRYYLMKIIKACQNFVYCIIF